MEKTHTPLSVWFWAAYLVTTQTPGMSALQFQRQLAVRERRRVRRDTTVSVLGCIYELQQGFLAGRVVDIVYSYLDDPPQPEVEYEDKRYPLSLVDPVGNSRRMRPLRHPGDAEPREPVVFDPSCTNDSAAAVGDDSDQEGVDEADWTWHGLDWNSEPAV